MTTQQQEGRNAARFLLWERLNHASDQVYLRYQRMTARHHGGKWLRGLIIHNGQVIFHYE